MDNEAFHSVSRNQIVMFRQKKGILYVSVIWTLSFQSLQALIIHYKLANNHLPKIKSNSARQMVLSIIITWLDV